MPSIKTFRPVVHEKKIFKGFCYMYMYINLHVYKIMSPYIRAWLFMTPGTLFEQS